MLRFAVTASAVNAASNRLCKGSFNCKAGYNSLAKLEKFALSYLSLRCRLAIWDFCLASNKFQKNYHDLTASETYVTDWIAVKQSYHFDWEIRRDLNKKWNWMFKIFVKIIQ